MLRTIVTKLQTLKIDVTTVTKTPIAFKKKRAYKLDLTKKLRLLSSFYLYSQKTLIYIHTKKYYQP